MLILTRCVSEIIGHDITVTVLGVKDNQTRLCIAAPKEVSVHHEEILERILAGGSQDSRRWSRRS